MTIEVKLDNILYTLTCIEAHLAGGPPSAAKAPAEPTKPATKTSAKPAANDAGTAALEYERDVKAPMMALANAKGRDAVTPIFTQFKVKTAKELKPEQWPAFVDAIAKAAA